MRYYQSMTGPITLQRLEGALILFASIWLYQLGHGHWGLFALLLFAADISMIGYLKSNRLGAVTYNLGHSYLIPGILALAYLLTNGQIPVLLFIWFSHIGLDRLLGYGLKDRTDFRHTHLGVIGQK